jgi:hypothetical protein
VDGLKGDLMVVLKAVKSVFLGVAVMVDLLGFLLAAWTASEMDSELVGERVF